MQTITWNEFKKINICVGTIIEAKEFKEALKPAYKLKVDLGSKIGIKNSSAQITDLYTKMGKACGTKVCFTIPKQ